MIYTHFIGRIGGKNAQVISGTHGRFVSFDMAVDNYSKGQAVTTWLRVRSSRENHINLAQYLTKGKMLLVEGTLNEPSIWTDRGGQNHVQLSVTADSINFVSIGKKKDGTVSTDSVTAAVPSDKPVEVPAGTPSDTSSDLPF